MLDTQVAVLQGLPEEVLDVAHVDPGRAQAGADLSWAEVGWQDCLESLDVDQVGGVVERRFPGGGELLPDVAGEVLGRRQELARARVVEHQPAEPLAGFARLDTEEAGHLGQVDLGPLVQADRQGVLGGVRPEAGGGRGDDAAGQQRGFAGVLGFGVEDLQGVDDTGEGVLGETAAGRAELGEAAFAGLVGPADLPERAPVHRPVGADIGVVAAVQLGPQLSDGLGVVPGGGFGLQQRLGRVP